MLERTDDESRREALATLRRRLVGTRVQDRRRRDGAVRRRRARAARRPARRRRAADAARTAPAGAAAGVARRRRSWRPSGSGSRCSSRSGRPPSSSCRPTTVVVCAYGLLIPEALLERGLWLNVHPSLLPRWRGAAPVERALLAGDDRDRRHDPRDGEGARRGADRGAAGLRGRPRGRRRRGLRRAAELAVELLDEVLPAAVVPAAGGRADLRREDRAGRPRARSLAAAGGEPEPDPRALAAHRRARRARRPPRHDLAGAARGRRARAGRGAAGGRRRMAYDAWLRGLR